MAGRFTGTINKLVKGLQHKYKKIYLVGTEQFYSVQQDRIITMFILSERKQGEDGRVYKTQILKTASQIDVVKYLAAKLKELEESS